MPVINAGLRDLLMSSEVDSNATEMRREMLGTGARTTHLRKSVHCVVAPSVPVSVEPRRGSSDVSRQPSDGALAAIDGTAPDGIVPDGIAPENRASPCGG